MERLTNKKEADAQRTAYRRRLVQGYPRNISEERFLTLAAYEDTGLEPEEITRLNQDVENRFLLWAEKHYGVSGGELLELVKAEQKRREGCIRCERKTCDTCYRFGWHPDICEKCEEQSHYSPKPFCPHCGRDLRGERNGI